MLSVLATPVADISIVDGLVVPPITPEIVKSSVLVEIVKD